MRLLLALIFLALTAAAPLPQLREQAAITDAITRERLDTLSPPLMRRHGVDMWLLLAREYAEDPVLSTMFDATNFHARRQTILVLYDPGPGRPIERLTVSRYGLGGLFAPAWDPAKQPDQWARLAELVAERNPRRIAVNMSALLAHADGLTHSQHEALMRALPAAYRPRVQSSGPLALAWLETRTPAEMTRYAEAVALAHGIIAQGFSAATIKPGRTTADDVVWFYRGAIADAGLTSWFHPTVNIFRRGAPRALSGDTVIQPGDMLWCDFGLTYLRLNTDTQQLAYVLRAGETNAPPGLRAGLAAANAVQDALTSSFATGRTGNEMLALARAKAISAGHQPSIYSHPIGFHGHAAGASIGFWDDQKPTDKGEHRLLPDTAWSIELMTTRAVPEWDNQAIDFRLEEDAFFDGRTVRYIEPRQTRFHLIP